MSDLQCDFVCPHADKVDAVYEKIITGNHERPIPERVRELEKQMSQALPILVELKTAADRQDGRDSERLDAERRNDKAWANFRRNLTIIIALGMLALAYLELNRQVKLENIRIPQVFHSQSREPVLSSTQRAGDPPAWIFNK